MAATEAVGDVQGVAPTPVILSFTHEAGPQGVAASVDMLKQATTAQIQLACAFPVGSKFGPQEVITSRGPLNKTAKHLAN